MFLNKTHIKKHILHNDAIHTIPFHSSLLF